MNLNKFTIQKSFAASAGAGDYSSIQEANYKLSNEEDIFNIEPDIKKSSH